MVLGKLDSNMQKNEPGSLSYAINSKWMNDLNVRLEAIKILEEKTGKNLFALCPSNFLLDTSPKGKGIKSKNELLGHHQTKNFCTAKGTISKTERQPMEWEKIFANDISDKGLVSNIYKELNVEYL